MGKRSPAPPPAPDYGQIAMLQGQANKEAAQQSAYMSNPNVYTPTAQQTVTWQKTPNFNQAQYDKAMAEFKAKSAAGVEGLTEPDREQFTTYIEQPTVRQELTGAAKDIFATQQQAEQAMANLGLREIGDLSSFLNQDFQAQLPAIQTSLGGYGAVTGAPNITGMGQAGALPQGAGGGISEAPSAANFNLQRGYNVGALPGQLGAGQQAGAGPAAPTNLGSIEGSQFYAQGGPGGGAFGQAGGGPSAGLFGFAGGGPQGLNLAGFDRGQVGGIANAPSGGQFGQAGAGPAAPGLEGLNLAGVGDVSRGLQAGQYGAAQGTLSTPELQRQLNTSGLAAMPVNAGMTAQNAIMSRLEPQLERERQQLQTQLINQGLRPGGEAYNAEMQLQAQKENDLRTQAAAQGISLDAQMRQQGLAEQQALGGFANQAALQQFGMGAQGLGLFNQAVAQNFQQGLAAQNAQNMAQQQAFQQRLASGQFGREAQMAAFGMGQQAQEAANRAVGQNFQQALAAQQAQNQAQQQGFGQQLAGQQFGRESALSGFQTQQAAQQAANAAAAQNFAQAQAAQQMQNQAIGQNFAQAQQAADAQRAAQAQNLQAALGAGQFNREALLQQFGMGQQAQQLANQAAAQNFGQSQQAAQFNLARQAQEAQQAAQQAGFFNQAQQAAYQQALAQQAATNAAQQQRFGQAMDVQGAQNAALLQNQQAALQQQQAANAAQQQMFNQAAGAAQFGNQATQQALQQQLALRNQPLNEITALLSGSQVQMPQFQGYSGVQVAPTPVMQGAQAQDAAAMQRYGIAANQAASNMSGLYGLAGAVAGAPSGGFLQGLFGR